MNNAPRMVTMERLAFSPVECVVPEIKLLPAIQGDE